MERLILVSYVVGVAAILWIIWGSWIACFLQDSWNSWSSWVSLISRPKPTCVFLNSASKLLANDDGGYLSSMTSTDLIRRGHGSPDELIEWTDIQKIRVLAAIPPELANKSTWIFALLPPETEWNYPHTRASTILLPPSLFASAAFRETLAHEMVHILQKQNPAKFAELYRQWEFAPVRDDAIPVTIREQIRNNPDTLTVPRRWIWRNRWIPVPLYTPLPINGRSGQVNYMLYDVKTGELETCERMTKWFGQRAMSQPEHPHEISALILANIIVNGASDEAEGYIIATKWWKQF